MTPERLWNTCGWRMQEVNVKSVFPGAKVLHRLPPSTLLATGELELSICLLLMGMNPIVVGSLVMFVVRSGLNWQVSLWCQA